MGQRGRDNWVVVGWIRTSRRTYKKLKNKGNKKEPYKYGKRSKGG